MRLGERRRRHLRVHAAAAGAGPSDGNVIANNALSGIIGVGTSRFNAIRNSISANGGLDIDLGGDGVTANDAPLMPTRANSLQNYPVITAVTTVGSDTPIDGVLNSTANTQFAIWVYVAPTCHPSGNGGAAITFTTFNITTNAAGVAGINHLFAGSVIAPGLFVTRRHGSFGEGVGVLAVLPAPVRR